MDILKNENKQTKQISFKIPVDFYKEVKHAAIDRDITVKDIFIQAIKKYLNEDRIVIEPLDEEDMKIIE